MKKLIKTIKNYHPPKMVCFIYLLVPLLICFIKNSVFDNDTWFLLHTGKYVLTKGLPWIEPFTIHKGLDFIMQQWLSATIFASIYQTFGSLGLVVFIALVDALIIFITYRLCMLISHHKFYLSIGITFSMSLLLSIFFIVGRPQIFSYLHFLLLFYSLESYLHTKKWQYLIILPIVSLLEINMHASMWWLLFCFLLPYIIDGIAFCFGIFQGEGYKIKPILIAVISMFVVGLINPYGIKAITYVFTSYGNFYIERMVNEMKTPNIREFSGWIVYGIMFLLLYLYGRNKNKKMKLRYVCLLLGSFVLALSAYRNFALLLLATFFPLAVYFEKEAYDKINEFSFATRKQQILYRATLCVLVIYLITIAITNTRFDSRHSLDGVIDYLTHTTTPEDSIIYTCYNDGGYLEFHGYHPYIDPRAEVFAKANNHKKDILKEYYQLQHGKLDSKEFLQTYSFTHLIVHKKDILYQDLKTNKTYKVVYQDANYQIYVPS